MTPWVGTPYILDRILLIICVCMNIQLCLFYVVTILKRLETKGPTFMVEKEAPFNYILNVHLYIRSASNIQCQYDNINLGIHNGLLLEKFFGIKADRLLTKSVSSKFSKYMQNK